MRVRSGILGALGFTLVAQGLGLITGVLSARLLGVAGRGLLAAIVLWPTSIAALGDLGFPVALAYMAARGEDSRRSVTRLAATVALAQSALVVGLGLLVLSVALRSASAGVWAASGVFMCIYVPSSFMARYLNSVSQGAGRYSAFNAVRLAAPVAYVVLILLLWASSHATPFSVAWAFALSWGVAAFVALLTRVRDRSPQGAGERIGWHRIVGAAAYGVKSHIGNLTPIDSMQLDLLVVATMFSPATAGLYSVAAGAALVVRAQASALGMIAMPEVARVDAAASVETAGRFIRMTVLGAAAACSGILLLAPWLIGLVYGAAYLPAVSLTRILAIGAMIGSVRQVLGDCLRGMGRPLDATIAECASWVATAAVGYALYRLLGAAGIAIAVCVGYACSLGIMTVAARRSGLAPSSLFLVRRDDLSRIVAALRPRAWSKLATTGADPE